MSTKPVSNPAGSRAFAFDRHCRPLHLSRFCNHVLSRDMSDRKRAFEANGDSASGVAKKLRRSVSIYHRISL